jgi:hypothetical protein
LSDRLSAVSLSSTARIVLNCVSTSGHDWEAGRILHPPNMKNPNHTLKKISIKNFNVISRT